MEANTSETIKHSDEIDLFDFITQLWGSKILILSITTCFTLCGLAYAFLSTPIFQSNSVVAPPSERDLIEIRKIQLLIDQIRKGNNPKESTDPKTIKSSDIFEIFTHSLNSNRYKEGFLSRPDVLEYFRLEGMSQFMAREAFDQALTIIIPKQTPYYQIKLSFETNSPELSARWLNEYIQYAHKRFVAELVNNIKSEISAAQNNLQLTIRSKITNYRTNLREEIKNLEEALIVAEEIGLDIPLKTEINFDRPLALDKMRGIYHLGSKSLKAELNALKARVKDIDSTPGLSDDRLNIELLDNINLDISSISTMTLDLPAEPNYKPIKPKRTLVIALSFVLGGIIGIAAALVRSLINSRYR